MKILVIDGRSLASLAAARSLGRDGHTIHCGESFKYNLSAYSKYVDNRVLYPDPSEDAEAFVSAILDRCRKEGYDLVLPSRDETTSILSEHKDEIEAVSDVYIPDPETLTPLLDKGETVKIAQDAGVPTPDTWFPESSSREEIKSKVEYPVLVRPRRSAGSRGIKRVSSDAEFDEAFDFVADEFGTPIVQEYIEKTGYTTACVLFDEAQRLVAEFSYERQKEYPLSGGPTVVGTSTDDVQAKQYAKELLDEAGWMGAAEVEFILDQNGEPRLLEVNPRFWMPIQLAISSGVDFPQLIQRLAAEEDPEPVRSYEAGLTYRWVLPNEILWAFNSRNKLSAIRDFVSFDRRTQCYGTLSLDDPRAVAGTIAQSLRFLTDAEKRRQIFDRGW